MDIERLAIQFLIVLAALAILWLFIKTLKIAWKIFVIVTVFLALSFALPAIREWIFSLI